MKSYKSVFSTRKQYVVKYKEKFTLLDYLLKIEYNTDIVRKINSRNDYKKYTK